MLHSIPPDILDGLRGAGSEVQAFVAKLEWYAKVASTMELGLRAAEQGAPEGWVIGADEQTAGRGQRGHTWESPAGAGVYFSVVLRPPVEDALAPDQPSPLRLLTLAAGVAVAEGIRAAAGLEVALKWPNDVLCGGRKLAGILAEGLAVSTPAQAVVLGIGVNLRSHDGYSDEVSARATSIQQEGGFANRAALLMGTLRTLAESYRKLLNGEFDALVARWRELAASTLGSRVEWTQPTGEMLTGTAIGIDRNGALLVQTPQGLQRVTTASLRWHLSEPL